MRATLLLAALPILALSITPQRGGDPGQGPAAGRGAQRDAGRGREAAPADEGRAELYFRVADHDGDGWISWREAQESLRFDKLRFEQLDLDGDGLLDKTEFLAAYRRTVERIGAFPPPVPRPGSEGERLLASAETEPTPGLWPTRPAASLLELFGEPREQDAGRSLVRLPPRIAGPVPAFERLDLDRDGRLSDADLDRLQRPVQMQVRRGTVLATLDLDGDGVVDRAEFYASMRSRAEALPQRP